MRVVLTIFSSTLCLYKNPPKVDLRYFLGLLWGDHIKSGYAPDAL